MSNTGFPIGSTGWSEMTMVMGMIVIFLLIGAYAERINRWVIVGLTSAIALVLIITYMRF